MRYFWGGCTIFRSPAGWAPPSVLLVLLPWGALAGELPVIEFSLKPRLCVLTEAEEVCYDELEVRWQTAKQMNLCLYRNDFDKPLACWQRAREGAHRFALSTTANVTFYLREDEQGLEVSEAFEVIHDNQQYRRQRRNPWSFF